MPEEPAPARKGKIARMPVAIRNEVNRRLMDGQTGPEIIAWLHQQEVVLQVLDKHFSEEPISPQNLSEWRQGGYQDWLERQEKIDRTKDLAEFALKLGQAAGGSIVDGSAAIAGGRIMEMLENVETQHLPKFIGALVGLRSTEIEAQKLKANMAFTEIKLKNKREELDLAQKKFRRQSLEMFFKWYADEKARQIMEGRGSNTEKMELLGQHIFGEAWEEEGES